MIKLRDYQNKTIDAIRTEFRKGNKKVIMCAPTGAGKTIMFTSMISDAVDKGKKCLVLTHRTELLMQASGSFSKFNLNPTLIVANKYPNLDGQLYVGMVETINRRLEREEYIEFFKTLDLIIFDESHLQNFDKIFDYIPDDTFVIGATATPYRKGKQQKSLDLFYNKLVEKVTTQDLIDSGFLVEAHVFGVKVDLKGVKRRGDDYDMERYYEENKTYKGVIDNYKRHSEHEKTLLFASNVESSKRVCEEFVANGYNAKHIDGSTPKAERKYIFEWFDKTEDAILCNCGIATTGFDQPDVKNIILYRATTSLPLLLQMCGRGSRLHEGKKKFNILDFGNNIERLGFWEDYREWSLKKVETKEKAAPTKTCKKCDALNPLPVKNCVACGEVFPISKREAEKVILEKLINSNKEAYSMTLEELIFCQKKGKLKTFYVWRIIRSRGRDELIRYKNMMNYKHGWYFHQYNKMKDEGY